MCVIQCISQIPVGLTQIQLLVGFKNCRLQVGTPVKKLLRFQGWIEWAGSGTAHSRAAKWHKTCMDVFTIENYTK